MKYIPGRHLIPQVANALLCGVMLIATCTLAHAEKADNNRVVRKTPTKKHTLSSPLKLLSNKGSDRATAYVMSNKIVRRGDHYLVTWIDSSRLNHWALIDQATGAIFKEGTVGKERRDNHCGAALAKDIDGTIHIMLGGHFSKLSHYRLPPGSFDWELVEDGKAIGKEGPCRAATYPSLICDNDGTLHLTYRSEPRARDAVLSYCRRPKDGKWSEPVALVNNIVEEHSWMHNAIQDAPSGRLHVLATITLPYPQFGPLARYYGAAHLYSDDGGLTWRQLGVKEPLSIPVKADSLQRIEGSEMSVDRTSPTHRGKGGPWHPYVYRMMLSNISLDNQGNPRIVMGNLMEGTAKLWIHSKDRGWTGKEIKPHVDSLTKDSGTSKFRIQHLASIARAPNEGLQMVLMVSPVASTGWGAAYTRLVRLRYDSELDFQSIDWIAESHDPEADWIPSLEYFNHRDPYKSPALLFTRGRNAGGYSNNVNDVETKVMFQIPAPAQTKKTTNSKSESNP